MQDSGGTVTDNENWRLEKEVSDRLKNDVVAFPMVTVNGVQTGATLSPAAVLSAICSGYSAGTAPDVCFCSDRFETSEDLLMCASDSKWRCVVRRPSFVVAAAAARSVGSFILPPPATPPHYPRPLFCTFDRTSRRSADAARPSRHVTRRDDDDDCRRRATERTRRRSGMVEDGTARCASVVRGTHTSAAAGGGSFCPSRSARPFVRRDPQLRRADAGPEPAADVRADSADRLAELRADGRPRLALQGGAGGGRCGERGAVRSAEARAGRTESGDRGDGGGQQVPHTCQQPEGEADRSQGGRRRARRPEPARHVHRRLCDRGRGHRRGRRALRLPEQGERHRALFVFY